MRENGRLFLRADSQAALVAERIFEDTTAPFSREMQCALRLRTDPGGPGEWHALRGRPATGR